MSGETTREKSELLATEITGSVREYNPPYDDSLLYTSPHVISDANRRRFFTSTTSQRRGITTENEPPLLEELGIDIEDILSKTIEVTFSQPEQTKNCKIFRGTDFSGPFLLCLMMGLILLFHGKVYFGYIYGLGTLSCSVIYCLFNMMSVTGITMGFTVTVLGYCLSPIVLLSVFSLILSLRGFFGTLISALMVIWSANISSKIFIVTLNMKEDQPLIAYPCALVYTAFALIAMF